MSLKRFAVFGVMVTLLGMLSGCPAHPGPNPDPIDPVGPDSRFQQPCADFCRHLRALQCQEGEPLPDGTSCETFCIDTQKAGHNLNIPCILQIQSCAEQQRCR